MYIFNDKLYIIDSSQLILKGVLIYCYLFLYLIFIGIFLNFLSYYRLIKFYIKYMLIIVYYEYGYDKFL